MAPWGRNPLMRGSDRFEGSICLLTVLVMVAAIPISLLIACATHSSAVARIRLDDAGKVPVTATVITAPLKEPVVAGVPSGRPQAPVRWNQRDRLVQTLTEVPATAKAGDRITLWLAPDGHPAAPPQQLDAAVIAGIGTGFATLLGVWFGAGVLYVLTGLVLSRRRSIGWAREWSQISGAVRHRRQ
ncbi:Rv1733c family protein [Nocardia sp. NBC_01327]|uniref:Rv1733c family protein n=1 Tax=Nocardia sp. NBC_01327 TaxID=2903593 RepID=UPI002E16651E|nr:hypothetical protein OG326_29205 [Nocardia sp. NBC_01327]